VSFKQHPEEFKVAEDPSGTPSALNLNSSGALIVNSANPTPSAPTDSSGNVLVTSPDLLYTLSELIQQVKKSNMYLALLVGEEIPDSDIEE
jgi:hypothetical protein